MNTIEKSIPFKIPDEMVREMSACDLFAVYQNNLVKKIRDREPGIDPKPIDRYPDPEFYTFFPLQEISLEKIENLPQSAIVSKHGLEDFAKTNTEPSPGAFHGIRLGRHVNVPIVVIKNDNGTYLVIDGIHRVAQAIVSDDKTILAFVEDGDGPTLRDVFQSVKNKKV